MKSQQAAEGTVQKQSRPQPEPARTETRQNWNQPETELARTAHRKNKPDLLIFWYDTFHCDLQLVINPNVKHLRNQNQK